MAIAATAGLAGEFCSAGRGRGSGAGVELHQRASLAIFGRNENEQDKEIGCDISTTAYCLDLP